MLSIIIIITPIKSMLISALILVIIDFITGITAAVKRKEKLTSSKMKRTVIKIMVYEVSILLAYIAQHYLIQDALPVINIISGFIGITELKSCLENINEIGGNNLLKSIIDKLGSQQEK